MQGCFDALFCVDSGNSMCFSYWKNVRLKHCVWVKLFWCSKGFSCYWKNVRLKPFCKPVYEAWLTGFSCYWKNVRLKLRTACGADYPSHEFQLLLKECTIEANPPKIPGFSSESFSCYWKNVRLKLKTLITSRRSSLFQLLLKECTIEAWTWSKKKRPSNVSVVIERMYDWSVDGQVLLLKGSMSFSCYWKNVRLKRTFTPTKRASLDVSVVIERMYDWSRSAVRSAHK